MFRPLSAVMAGQAGRFIGAFTNEKSIPIEAEQMALSEGAGIFVGILRLIGTGLISLKQLAFPCYSWRASLDCLLECPLLSKI